MNDDTRRIATQLAGSIFIDKPCRICRQPLGWSEDDTTVGVYAGWSRDGEACAAHKVCWENFVELLQTTPAQELYELVNGLGEELDEDGKRDVVSGKPTQ